MHDLDVCFCGDYRRDHKNGTGACAFNAYPMNGGASHGFRRCHKFRLSEAHEPATKDSAPAR